MAKIGFSLPPAYLVQRDTSPDNVWIRALGKPEDALRQLKERGLNSVELRMVRPGMDPALIRAALDVVTQAGLGFTIHGLLPPSEDQTGAVEGFPLWELADHIREKQGEATIPLHAKFRTEGALELVIADTVSALRRLLEECEQRRAPFRFALEINKSKARVDPSFTWDGVSAIVREVNHPALGICWDFGHAFYNHHIGLIPAEPPASFLEKVMHTHIHDVSPEYKTHWPLREGRVPVARHCESLHSVGYAGVYNLELDPPRYPNYENLKDALLDSVLALKEIVQNHGG
jgi:sugar phosphate isomerase/epimerase